MALVACNECQKEISDQAAACPHCGAPVGQRNQNSAHQNFGNPQLVKTAKEILQNLANSLIDAAQSWHAHRHEAKQP